MTRPVDPLMNPADFPPQAPAANPRVAEYDRDASAASAAVLAGFRPARHAYGAHPSQRLDVFTPPGGNGLRPALIFFHGGAWIAGYPWWTGFMAPGVAAAGGILIAPSYRLAPEARFPAQLHDVAAAIDWVWRNAADLGIDRRRIVVGGHSAGGHLAVLACLHPAGLAATSVPPAAIRACMPLSCSFNLHYPDAEPGSGEERVYRFLLARDSDDLDASPLTHAATPMSPLHVVMGESDFDRIRRTTVEMVTRLDALGRPVTLDEWPAHDHFDTHLALRDPDHPWFTRLRDIFDAPAMETTDAE